MKQYLSDRANIWTGSYHSPRNSSRDGLNRGTSNEYDVPRRGWEPQSSPPDFRVFDSGFDESIKSKESLWSVMTKCFRDCQVPQR